MIHMHTPQERLKSDRESHRTGSNASQLLASHPPEGRKQGRPSYKLLSLTSELSNRPTLLFFFLFFFSFPNPSSIFCPSDSRSPLSPLSDRGRCFDHFLHKQPDQPIFASSADRQNSLGANGQGRERVRFVWVLR